LLWSGCRDAAARIPNTGQAAATPQPPPWALTHSACLPPPPFPPLADNACATELLQGQALLSTGPSCLKSLNGSRQLVLAASGEISLFDTSRGDPQRIFLLTFWLCTKSATSCLTSTT
jgi:hypothetical protein